MPIIPALDLLPTPVVVYDGSTGRVVFANTCSTRQLPANSGSSPGLQALLAQLVQQDHGSHGKDRPRVVSWEEGPPPAAARCEGCCGGGRSASSSNRGGKGEKAARARPALARPHVAQRHPPTTHHHPACAR